MPRGAKKKTIPTVEWKLHIDGLLAAQVELFLMDPMRNKPRKGARSTLTEQLYRQWIAEQIRARQAAGQPVPVAIAAPEHDGS